MKQTNIDQGLGVCMLDKKIEKRYTKRSETGNLLDLKHERKIKLCKVRQKILEK